MASIPQSSNLSLNSIELKSVSVTKSAISKTSVVFDKCSIMNK